MNETVKISGLTKSYKEIEVLPHEVSESSGP